MESSLVLKKSDFYARVAIQFGFSTNEDDLTEKQLFVVKDCVDSGTRRFYDAHRWSFLRPWVTLTAASGVSVVSLPDDMAGFEGSVTVTDSSSGSFKPVEFQNPTFIHGLFARFPDATGCPQYVGERQLKGTTENRSDRQELVIFPTTDAVYYLKFQYYLRASVLKDDHPFAYGGSDNSEVILAACLMVKEQRYDQMLDGPFTVDYQRQLAIALDKDNRKKPRILGMTRDTSDGPEETWRIFDPVTINGVAYD